MSDDAIELAARAVAKAEAEHFGRDLTEADWQAGRLMWSKAVAPLVEQLRQAEVSRDAYRDERDAKEAVGDHLADSREDHLDTRIALAAERESRFRWAEEAARLEAEVKRLNALVDWYNKSGTIELASHDRAMNERDARIAEVTSELAALRASAVVLPEDWLHLVERAIAEADGLGPITVDAATGAIETLIESWRPATVEAAPTERVDTEWCIFYGGTHPSNSAGTELYDDEADATEKLPLYWQWQPTGVAKRTVRRGPWEITQAAGVSGTGTEASDA